jgi:NTP pyrophosphatase (non-canonical NTP hydrolase)
MHAKELLIKMEELKIEREKQNHRNDKLYRDIKLLASEESYELTDTMLEELILLQKRNRVINKKYQEIQAKVAIIIEELK